MKEIYDYLLEGEKCMAQFDFSTAIEYFEAVLEIEPENEKALLDKAYCLQQQGNIMKAKKCYYRVLSNNPDQEDAIQCLENLMSGKVENIKHEVSRNSDNDFRVAKWGESRESIIKKEGEPNLMDSNPDYYMFKNHIAGMDCVVNYGFTDNKFTMGTYLIDEQHSNTNNYIDDYSKLVKLLTQKYGEPTRGGENNMIWHNDLYIDDYDNWGLAISAGHLTFSAFWETEKSEINVYLGGDNYEISLAIQYESRELKSLRETKTFEDDLKWL